MAGYPSYSVQDANEVVINGNLAADTALGLSSIPKFLLPKYFYDDRGSAIFREIMNMPGYYLTACEYEILLEHSASIAAHLSEGASFLNILEPGAGDGSKTVLLLKAMVNAGIDFRFVPVDISNEANEVLRDTIIAELPEADVRPLTGDYFHMFNSSEINPGERNVIIFLGSNIGNLNNNELHLFLQNISDYTLRGDKLLIGFDLKKSPSVIMKAYDDPYGLTRKFNLNHLLRLNNELHADFDVSLFEHHTYYNPVSGELKSFLVSTAEQHIHIGAIGDTFTIGQWEPLFMEMSRKFDLHALESIAISHGFRIVKNFTDRRNWFVDSLWTRT